ncbi:MAG: GNAT family N-acetyltransferase [Acidimicrobiia bacterium]
MGEVDDVVIRSATGVDAPAVLELWAAADAAPSVTDDVESIERLVRWDAAGLLLACVDNRVVGSLVAVWDGWRGNMYRLAVHPDFRRRGTARALVDAGEQRLRTHGARRVTALVLREHDEAVGFWRAAGYDPDPRIDRYVVAFEPGPAG